MSEANPSKHQAPQLIKAAGAWPFITHRIYRHVDGARRAWHSRHHRKGLNLPKAGERYPIASVLARSLWQPKVLNWWIGLVFIIGASGFALGSLLCLIPAWPKAWGLSETEINAIFFAASIPFTTAGYLQLYQAANAGRTDGKRHWFGWKPKDAGWLSCALQFVGTVMFNFNTFDALLSNLNREAELLLIWTPNVLGSILFLLSGYIAFIEICHRHWAIKPKQISWWVTFINLLGCIAFMISACFAFVPEHAPSFDAVEISIVFTLAGALCFLLGSYLMWPESIVAHADQ
ncbi:MULTISPECIES: hypothetical protein [unclassified Lentimonas]|nr:MULTISPECIES: hypothetical protein [unclassified Lentimonas]CAA6686748.1 Possible NADH-Ubiquinone/plastoquinone [Lentimonas sp. CC6]CAA6692853.1 Possible NADH-Ubiquinone/plastoquinone [Lentimonas sp. CC10]CAA7069889.1 Possible NADH-Ubiquinone/plastoquinone [Lentimonas sp. CC11]CAA7168167.1 Possible NADH-Ubiquinone/plastoquinone [Lentimonas sp. CC21]CAA6676942.1 Possible NADH-Ubiquinone/plastoquinone [Lentimonas sp. CC4]